jgi:hypothetical protein
MVRTIPFTHYVEFVAEARAIQRSLKRQGTAPAVRQAVEDLADLAVRALAETNDALEGLASLVMALHPEVTRRPRASRVTDKARR